MRLAFLGTPDFAVRSLAELVAAGHDVAAVYAQPPAPRGRGQAVGLDAAVVVAYGQILPPEVLEAPRLGAFNLHASLLPRWRGAAPIQRAIMAGGAESGAVVVKKDARLDIRDTVL